MRWIDEQVGVSGTPGDGTLGATYIGLNDWCADPDSETSGGVWLFNVVDPSGNVIFVEKRPGPNDPGWPGPARWLPNTAMKYAKTLWEKFFPSANAGKAKVCFWMVEHPQTVDTSFSPPPAGGFFRFEARPLITCSPMAYDGVGWLRQKDLNGQKDPNDSSPCGIQQVNVSTSNPVQSVTCPEFCAKLYGPSGSYPNSQQYTTCLNGCTRPVRLRPTTTVAPFTPYTPPSIPIGYQDPYAPVAPIPPAFRQPPQYQLAGPEQGALGAVGLDAGKNMHAKTVLAMWNKANNYVFTGYPAPDDILNTGWDWRDAKMLGNFVVWWDNAANPPLKNWAQQPLPQPSFSSGFQQSDLTEQHLAALDTWATKTGAGLPSCIETCLANLTGSIGPGATQAQISQCIDQCAGGAQVPKCPGNMYWDEAAGTCKCPPGSLWDGTKCMQLPPPIPTCPPGQAWDGTQCVSLVIPPPPPPVAVVCPPGQLYDPVTNTCKAIALPPGQVRPLPPPPEQTPKETQRRAGMVLGVLAGVAVVGLIINALIKVPPPPAMSSNPRRRKKTPILVDIQCESPLDFRDFKRIAGGGTPEMFGHDDPENRAWRLPDAIEHMHPRFHQLLQATGCRAVEVEPLRGNPKKPVPETGYAYFYDGSNWKRADDELWDTEVMSYDELEGAQHVGTRVIDGTRVNVWQLKHGKPFEDQIEFGHHYVAQTAR